MKPRVSSLPITAALVLTAIIAVLGGARPAAAAAPDAVDDYYSLYQGKTLVVPYNTLAAPWANDTDADGDIANANFECDLGSTAFYGSFTIDKNCGITYTPDPSFVGQDAAVYRLSDGSSSDLGVIYFEVKAGAPISQDDLYSTPQDTPINVPAPGVLANDSDPDGDPLIIAGYTQPADGTVTLNNDGSFTFTPNIGFFGYTYFQYQAWAGGLVSKNAVVTIDVQQEVNTPPVVQDDAYATTQDTPLDVPWPGVFANDSDPDGDQLFVDPAYSQPAKGTVTLNSDGTFTFTPDPGFVGSTNFQYQAYDGLAASNWATVTIDVQKANTPPVAQDDAYVTPQDTPLVVAGPGFLANDSDADGDQLYPGTYSLPAAGTLLLGPDGGFTYTPNPGFVGSDSFSYNAYDGLTGSQLSALVTIDVQAANGNTPPVVNDHSESAIEDDPGAKLVSLLFYASDPDSSGTLTVDSYTNPSHGSLVVDLATGDATYIPDPDYFGPDSFTYVVSDGTDLSAPGTVTIDVIPEGDPGAPDNPGDPNDPDDPNDPGDPGDPDAPDKPGGETGASGEPGTTSGNPGKTSPDRPNTVTALPDTGAGSESRPAEGTDLVLATLLSLGGLVAAAGLRRFVAAQRRRG